MSPDLSQSVLAAVAFDSRYEVDGLESSDDRTDKEERKEFNRISGRQKGQLDRLRGRANRTIEIAMVSS